jgi:NADH oxidase (H2O2-forming)
VKFGLTLNDLASMENVYSPAIGALNEPIVLAAQNGVENATAARAG